MTDAPLLTGLRIRLSSLFSPHKKAAANRNPGGTIRLRRISRAHRALKEFLNLKTRTKRPRKTQSVSHLPLFSWRVAVVQPGTRAGLHLSRQYPVRPATAPDHRLRSSVRSSMRFRNSLEQRKARAMDEHQDSVEFLALLRPGGPWVLTAIEPDGKIETMTARCRPDIPAGTSHPLCGAIRSDVTQSKPRGPS